MAITKKQPHVCRVLVYLKSKVVFDVDGDERLDPVDLAPKRLDVSDQEGELPLGVWAYIIVIPLFF